MKLSLAVFLATVAVSIVVVILLVIPEPENVGPVRHPDFPSMWHSGGGRSSAGEAEARESPLVLGLGWAFGTTMTLLFSLLMAFGARKGERSLRGLGRPLALATLLNLAAWTLLVLSYRGLPQDADSTLFLSLPIPSAVMVYVYFPLTALFNLLFVAGYARWVLSAQDWSDYQQIVRRSEIAQRDSTRKG